MNEQKIEEIKNTIRELIQVIVQKGEPLSNEMKLNIAQVMEYAASRIQELRQQESNNPVDGLSPTPVQNQLEPGPYPSSNINSFKYDPYNQQLFVKFHGEDSADSGPTYSYQGVPEYIYNIFSQGSIGPKTSGQNQYHRWIKGVTPSLGGTMNALIKAGGFHSQRLS